MPGTFKPGGWRWEGNERRTQCVAAVTPPIQIIFPRSEPRPNVPRHKLTLHARVDKRILRQAITESKHAGGSSVSSSAPLLRCWVAGWDPVFETGLFYCTKPRICCLMRGCFFRSRHPIPGFYFYVYCGYQLPPVCHWLASDYAWKYRAPPSRASAWAPLGGLAFWMPEDHLVLCPALDLRFGDGPLVSIGAAEEQDLASRLELIPDFQVIHAIPGI